MRMGAIACLLGAVGVAAAHHSGAAYDRQQVLEVEGVVDAWSWSNPHSSLRIFVPGESDDDVLWIFEALPAGLIVQQGYRRSSFRPGDRVKILYNPLRDGAPGGNLRGAILADGTAVGQAASQ